MPIVFWFGVSVVATATISGMFGMAGGMILMGIYASILPVPQAIMLHGITQMSSNGSRFWIFRKHVYWTGVGYFAVGSAISLALLASLGIVLEKATFFFVLGSIPLLALLLPKSRAPRFEVPAHAFACGLLVTSVQLLAGVAGPLLDVFFVRGGLNRHQVVATKALTQTFSHLLKLVYFGALLRTGWDQIPPAAVPVVLIAAPIGTRLGKVVLDRMSEVGFRRWTTGLVVTIGLVYLARGFAAR